MTHPPLELEHDLEVRRSTYEWSVRLFRVLQKVLKVNVKLHHSEGQIDEGEIFLFNHPFRTLLNFYPSVSDLSRDRCDVTLGSGGGVLRQ